MHSATSESGMPYQRHVEDHPTELEKSLLKLLAGPFSTLGLRGRHDVGHGHHHVYGLEDVSDEHFSQFPAEGVHDVARGEVEDEEVDGEDEEVAFFYCRSDK